MVSAGGVRPARMLVEMGMQLRLEGRRQRAMPVLFLLLQRLVVRVGRRSRVAHYDGRLILLMGALTICDSNLRLVSSSSIIMSS